MAISILMPALSPTMTDGTLARWAVKEGDAVRSGDVIAEIETDKATMEVEALDDGIVAKLMAKEGEQNVAVNRVIAILAEEGENSDEAISAIDEAKSETKPETAEPQESKAIDQPEIKTPSAQSAPIKPTEKSGARKFASPLAKRIAEDSGLDLTMIEGTGPHGRIIRVDIEDALVKGGSKSASVLANQKQAIGGEDDHDYLVPHSAMRRVIADRLQQSKQTAPHFYLTIDCEIDALLQARKALNMAVEEGVKISVNDMVVKASAAALMAVPEVNGYFEDEGCRYFKHADICIAVAIDNGLITPVIRQVDQLGLTAIAKSSSDLAMRARGGQLDPSEYTGGTFTISNLGMFGIKEFSAVINPPQSSILAVGAGEKRPIVKEDKIEIATMMSVTLSADHRIVDGALGARWLQAFKQAIENPVTMLL